MSLFPWSLLKGKPTSRPGSSRPAPSLKVVRDNSSQHASAKGEPLAGSTAPKRIVPAASLRVTNTAELEKHVQLESMPQKRTLELFCPVRRARIFCHSVLVDKLGGLTKFIVSSLYEGHSIEEISDLTRMGKTTITEEIDYLVRGGLLSDDGTSLTALGRQYGELLKAFDELSDGIAASLNEFATLFEPIEREYAQAPNQERVLRSNWIPALSRNDNYANSLAIALEHLKADIPFSTEIRDSLYTTVQIDNEMAGYKKLRIKDLGKGLEHAIEPCIGVAIPYARVTYRPRYSQIDPYRNDLEMIRDVEEEHAEQLLTGFARQLLGLANEEDSACKLVVEINEITGAIHKPVNVETAVLKGNGLIRMEGYTSLRAVLDASESKDLYLEEMGREEHFRVSFFTYEEMEAC